ncbi:MAG: hypothetical protein QM496_16480 [Verrucomicrobiota bacterium]
MRLVILIFSFYLTQALGGSEVEKRNEEGGVSYYRNGNMILQSQSLTDVLVSNSIFHDGRRIASYQYLKKSGEGRFTVSGNTEGIVLAFIDKNGDDVIDEIHITTEMDRGTGMKLLEAFKVSSNHLLVPFTNNDFVPYWKTEKVLEEALKKIRVKK